MDISIILPKFNSKGLALESLKALKGHFALTGFSHEIILVDDGSRLEERISTSEAGPGVRIIQLEKNRGKGYAVKQGMLAAKGDCCIYTDIDLPYDLSAITYSFRLIKDQKFDFVAGDRTINYSSDVASRPLIRKLASKVFSRGIALLVIGGIFDSQCGFKALSRRLSRMVFPLLTINRFSFDVELYYLLLKYNIVIKRIPVRLQRHDVSTVSLFAHLWEMTWEVVGIPFKWHRGRYVSEVLADFYRADKYWEK